MPDQTRPDQTRPDQTRPEYRPLYKKVGGVNVKASNFSEKERAGPFSFGCFIYLTKSIKANKGGNMYGKSFQVKSKAVLLLLLAGFFFYDAAALAETNTPSIVIDGPVILPPEVQAKTDEDSAYYGEATSPKGSGYISNIYGYYFTAAPYNNRGTYVSGTNLYVQAPYPGVALTYYYHGVEVTATTAGKYYLNISSEPALPWNPFMTIPSGVPINESAHYDMVANEKRVIGLFWIYPQYTNYGGAISIELKEDVLLLDPVLQTKTYYCNSDADLPTSSVVPLTINRTDTVFTVSWSGSDGTASGNSGLWKYDVQYKIDGGAWTDWKVGVTTTSSSFTARTGHTYYFQSRAYDHVGNVELYPGGNGDTYTIIPTLYNVNFTTYTTGTTSGLQIKIDGVAKTAPFTEKWFSGATHSIEAFTQSGGTGKQYTFMLWKKDGAFQSTWNSIVSTSVTANTNIECDYYTEYQLTMVKGTGCATTTPTAGTSWQRDNVGVPINATASTGYNWSNWSGSGTGSYTGTTQSNTIYLGGPVTQTANFVAPLVSITVTTNPAGRSIIVDGTTYTAPQTFSWTSGSSHTINTTSPQAGTTGTQYVYSSWSDAGAQSHTVTPTSNTTYTCNFTTQYYLTMVAGTGGTVSPASGWKNAAATQAISATANTGYTFSSWTGSGTGSYTGTTNATNITMNGPITESASFTVNGVLTISFNGNPTGRTIIVDGTTYTTPWSTTAWTAGSTHTINTTSPQAGTTGTQYVYSSWSDGGAQSHTITTPASNTTYTCNFTTQYYLTMVPGTGGTVSPASGWKNAAATQAISATANTGYTFSSWTGSGTGSYTGTTNSTNITINGPITETANFTMGTGDPYEPNDTYTGAYHIYYGDSLTACVIDPEADYDWFYFDGAAGDSVQMTAYAYNILAGSTLDSYIALYASDGTTYITGNDDWPGLYYSSRIEYVLSLSGRYYIKVSQLGYKGSKGPSTNSKAIVDNYNCVANVSNDAQSLSSKAIKINYQFINKGVQITDSKAIEDNYHLVLKKLNTGGATHGLGISPTDPTLVGNAFSAQNFETAYDIYDSWGGDDFFVWGDSAIVKSVSIIGSYSATGPTDSLYLAITTDSSNYPALSHTVWSGHILPANYTDNAGSFDKPAQPGPPDAGPLLVRDAGHDELRPS